MTGIRCLPTAAMDDKAARRGGTKMSGLRCRGMPQKADPAALTRAEALFKQRQAQLVDAPKAMAEYRAAERAKYARMQQLRELRLAHEAQMHDAHVRNG
jgi:hypothetical protein